MGEYADMQIVMQIDRAMRIPKVFKKSRKKLLKIVAKKLLKRQIRMMKQYETIYVLRRTYNKTYDKTNVDIVAVSKSVDTLKEVAEKDAAKIRKDEKWEYIDDAEVLQIVTGPRASLVLYITEHVMT